MSPAFDSLADLVAMGGHGPYVWSAYAIGAVAVAAEIVAVLRRGRRALERAAAPDPDAGTPDDLLDT